MNFVLWIERNTGYDYNSGVRWTLKRKGSEYDINIQFSCLTVYHLKKINNKFRTLSTRLYHSEDK